MSDSLSPQAIVEKLNRHIIGQDEAKRAVAVAIRNRWRRQQLEEEIAQEIPPRNIIMIGATGVGKTEIARRLAKLTGAPFIKVEATKFTEVGYHGRDVESMIRDLVDKAFGLVRDEQAIIVKEKAEQRAEEVILDKLLPGSASEPDYDSDDSYGSFNNMDDSQRAMAEISRMFSTGGEAIKTDSPNAGDSGSSEGNESSGASGVSGGGWVKEEDSVQGQQMLRDRLREQLKKGELDKKEIEIITQNKPRVSVMMGGMGMDQMDPDMAGMFEKLIPQESKTRRMSIAEARKIIIEEETDKLLDKDKIAQEAIKRTEESGILFLDEIDKVAIPDNGGKSGGPDVSRQGVQRDLLPIVEGSAVNTKHGIIHTDHILFIAAGAFHTAKPSDLMPELQGRFPVRVELNSLTKDDFIRILTEPDNAITRQQQLLLEVEGLKVEFTDGTYEKIAELAAKANSQLENIGARRLITIVEKIFEKLNFDAPEMVEAGTKDFKLTIDYINEQVKEIMENEDLSRYVL